MTAGYPTRDRAESSPVMVPHAPALVAGFREVVWLSPDGEIEALSPDEARDRLDGGETAFVCHARATARRLGLAALPALDLLELFAFVRPARFCVPTPRGLAAALGLVVPRNTAEACVALVTAARALLQELGGDGDANTRALAALAAADPAALRGARGLRVWQRLAEWQDAAPRPPLGNLTVAAEEACSRLAALLGEDAEARPQQAE